MAKARAASRPTCQHGCVQEIHVESISLERLAGLLERPRAVQLASHAARTQALLDGRTVWNVNSTASGGGVAEMLQALLAYARGAGVDARWLTIEAGPEFFRLTKRLHNWLHGSPGDGGTIDGTQRRTYEDTLMRNLSALREHVRPGDVVLLHDPQVAGLADGLRELGCHVAWRCHIGRDDPHELTERGWEFLRPYLYQVEAVVFSRRSYAPRWVDHDRLWVIPPSLDPFSAKNCELTDAEVRACLRRAGLVGFGDDGDGYGFVRRDGSAGTVRRHSGLVLTGGVVPAQARVVLQVSRWDRLKDMAGVLRGFIQQSARLPEDAHLVLAGPDVSGVTDDPEGQEVLEECLSLHRDLPRQDRERVHLCSLPMDDIDENAHLVNALQRHASVVVQKSLVEGFGLTVTEPMWKGRAVVATRVGGIQDQIVHGESGLLLDDPRNLDELGARLRELLLDPGLASRLGVAARERVRDRFLGDRHLVQYAELIDQLVRR